MAIADKVRAELILRICENALLVREQHPMLRYDANRVVLTSSRELYNRILNEYNGPIFGVQIAGKYEFDKRRKVQRAHYAISHLKQTYLEPILNSTKEEYICGILHENILVLAE